MASEAAKKWVASGNKRAKLTAKGTIDMRYKQWFTASRFDNKQAEAYDAGAAAVMERLQNEAEKVIANTPPSERAPVASAVRYLLRRMGEPA